MARARTADEAVRRGFQSGQSVDLRLGPAVADTTTVAAETLVELLTGRALARLPGPVPRLAGARIVGELELAGARVAVPLRFADCEFDTAPDLRMARLEGLALSGCRLPGLRAGNLRVAADLLLDGGLRSDGPVELNDAHVGGTVRLDNAELRAPGGFALLGERLDVGGALYARRLRTSGEIRIPGARVTGNVNLGGAWLSNPDGDALDATGIDVTGSLLADRFGRRGALVSADPGDRFRSDGRFLLAGARIGGDLVLTGSQIRRHVPAAPAVDGSADSGVGGAAPVDTSVAPGRNGSPENVGTVGTGLVPAEQSMRVIPRGIVDPDACLVADRIRVEGNLELDDGFNAHGTVRLPNAVVGGYLRLSGADLGQADRDDSTLERAGDPGQPVALLGDGMEIGGDLEGRDDGAGALRVMGQLRLVDTHVRGSASLSGIELVGPGTDVLFADRLRIGGMLYLRRVRSAGSVRMQNAHVGSTLDCSGAVLEHPRLRADGTAKPSLDLRAAVIGKDLLLREGFRATGGIRIRVIEAHKSIHLEDAVLGGVPAPYALNGYGLSTAELILRLSAPPGGLVRLAQARVGSFADCAELWAADGGVAVDGFVFQTLDTDSDVATRLRWLEGALPDYAPGPYEQLAAAYRRDGDEESVEQVQIARQRRRYRTLGPAGKTWGELQRCTVGFGYRPWLAVCWLAAFWLLGGLWFRFHQLLPVDDGQHPVWNPWLYSADTLLPIINLGQDGFWRPDGASQWISSGLIAVGWILASTAAAGAARILKRS